MESEIVRDCVKDAKEIVICCSSTYALATLSRDPERFC